MTEQHQEIKLNDRRELKLTGVLAVAISNETKTVLETVTGTLIIEGSDLKILYLDPGNTAAAVSGKIDALRFGEAAATKWKSFLRRAGK